jgi:hypothetical protein
MEEHEMLYRTRRSDALRYVAARLLGAVLTVVASLKKQSADRRQLDGLRNSELEELGLRRTDQRDYRTFL